MESPGPNAGCNTTEDQKILWSDHLLETSNLGIGFGIENGEWFYGFCSIDHQNAVLESEMLRKLQSRLSEVNTLGALDLPTIYWPASRWWREIPSNWLWDLKMIGEYYFDKTSTDDFAVCGSTSGFVDKVAILAKEMKRIAHEVFEKS